MNVNFNKMLETLIGIMSTVGNVDRYKGMTLGRHTCRPTDDRHSTDTRSSVGRLSIVSRPSGDTVSIECRPLPSTDMAVDIAVDITYSKHDPIFQRSYAQYLYQIHIP